MAWLAGWRLDVGKASDWLREERRKVLGDSVAFCLELRRGASLNSDELEDEVPARSASDGATERLLLGCPVL